MIGLAAFLFLIGLVAIGCSLVFFDTARDQDGRALAAAAWLVTAGLAGFGVLCLIGAVDALSIAA